MKVWKILAVILLLSISVNLFAQEDGAYVYKKPKVLFNTRGVSNYVLLEQLVDINNPNGYKVFADMAKADGNICSQQKITTISSNLLNNYDILILPVPYSPTAAEAIALKDFINDGGGLLLMVDLASKYSPLSNWKAFLKEYGIGFAAGNLSNTNMNINLNVILSQPWRITSIKVPTKESGSSPTQWVSTYLTVDSKKAVAAANGNVKKKIFAAISTSHNLGKGRIVVLGDWLLFNSGYWESGVPIDQKDNLDFSRNVLNYLNGAGDLTALSVTPRKNEYAAGKLLKCRIKLTNIGTQSSFATTVNVYLSKKRILHAKTNSPILLGSFGLSAIHPDISRNINFKKKVPAGTKDGRYYVIIDIDPKHERDELYFDNNIVRSKKRVKITN